ncbi:MAG TPA: glycerol-3-phosphate dehydrogenase/oxidase, partial [Tepidisphaeraceae bacterium]|nr:glycerol-3-phosphate dehydrogenase/oxidase [Tepidisphaeraceae bacterium]
MSANFLGWCEGLSSGIDRATTPPTVRRESSLNRLISQSDPWDLAVIGGGATGVGIAVDAASRGYSCCLLEQSDFGKGTSSRSTKLIHGGVRYLQQGNISLVMEALKERGILRRNAPHLVHDLAFVVPNYSWWEAPFYGIGMKVYDVLAGRHGFGKSRVLSRDKVLEHIPTLEQAGLRGGVLYYDGQFDDARLLIDLAHTADAQGAVLLNYAKVVRLNHDSEGFVNGLTFRDIESGNDHDVQARCVINATGAFSDEVRRMDEPDSPPMIAPSQGVHLVLDRSFLPGDAAIMVPRTSDGRVMFAIPWLGHTLLGTTDTPITDVSLDPTPLAQEVDFILETAAKYLARDPSRSDVLSAFAGIRPLVKNTEASSTAALSRDHTIHVAKSGLLTIAGGKWTTYRRMAKDCVDHAATLAQLEERPCLTRDLQIHGADGEGDAELKKLIEGDPTLADALSAQLSITAAHVVLSARSEMARTVDDVLARRTRALFLNAKAAVDMAPIVARLLGRELSRDQAWIDRQIGDFTHLA